MVAREGGGGEGSLLDSRGILDEFKMGLLITGVRWINNEVASAHSGPYITFAPGCSKTSILICRYTFVYVRGCVRGVVCDGTGTWKSIHFSPWDWLLKERLVMAASQHISPEVNDPPHLGATSTWWNVISSTEVTQGFGWFRCWCPRFISSSPLPFVAAVAWTLNDNACSAGGATDPAPELHAGVRAWSECTWHRCDYCRSLKCPPMLLAHLLSITITSGCMYPNHHWGDWNDSQLLPTIQKLMKGYNRYLRPNFNGKIILIQMEESYLIVCCWLNACLSLNEINDLFLVSTCGRGSCWDWNEPRYRQHWCHLRNQYGTPLCLTFETLGLKKEKKTARGNGEWINILAINISGLHGHHLSPSEVAGLQVGVPG